MLNMEKQYDITNDHIGIFDNYFDENLIDEYFEFYKLCSLSNHTWTREEEKNITQDLKNDTAASLMNLKFYNDNGELVLPYSAKPFIETVFTEIYPLYVKKYSALSQIQRHSIFDIKIQKTEPTEGYHIWHQESEGFSTRNRLMAFILYMNDVEEGGETEFLYQSLRIKPKRNRFILWPAYYTHLHRGNPPLSGTKYIMTGWIEYGSW